MLNLKKSTLIILAAIIIVLLFTISYALSFGKLDIAIADGGVYRYYRVNSSGTNEKKKGNASAVKWLKSGEYAIEYEARGSISIKYVTVPSSLRTVNVDLRAAVLHHVERVATNTLSVIATDGKDALFSMSDMGGTIKINNISRPLEASTVSGLQFAAHRVIVNNKLINVVASTTTKEGFGKLQIYDFATAKTTELPKLYPISVGDYFLRQASVNDSTVFGIGYQSNDKTMFDIYKDTTLVSSIDVTSAALSNDGPAIAFTDSSYVIGYGSSGVEDDDKNKENTELKKYTVETHSTASKDTTGDMSLGNININSLSISPNGHTIAATTDGSLLLYDVPEHKELIRADLPAVTSMTWLDNDRLLVATVEGISVVNITDRTNETIFTNKNLKISTVTASGNTVLFTAYSNVASFEASGLLEAYRLDLSQSSKDDNQLLSKLPRQTNTYRMEAFQKTIYITSNGATSPGTYTSEKYRNILPTQSAEDEAVAYLKSNLDNYQQYKVVLIK